MMQLVAVFMGMLVASSIEGAHAAPDLIARYEDDFPRSLDFRDELEARHFALVSETDLGDGFVRVEVELEVHNLGGAVFLEVVAVPGGGGALAAARAVEAARFGGVSAGGDASSEEPMWVELPVDEVDTLLRELEDGTVEFVVLAHELPQLAEGRVLYQWTEADDFAYQQAMNLPEDPFGDRPWDPAEVFQGTLYYAGVVPSELRDWDPSDHVLYFAPAAGAHFDYLPRGFHYFVADEVEIEKAPGTGSLVTVTGRVSDAEHLVDIYDYASFSTETYGQIDWDVRGTRLTEIDGDEVPAEVRDARTAPIRFNRLRFFDGTVTVSGQIHGTALRPTVSLRIRPDGSRLVAGIETELTIAAQISAEEVQAAREDIELYSLCYPLPDLAFGPVSIPMTLELDQSVFVEGAFHRGATFGFEQTLRTGFQVVCEGPGLNLTCREEPIVAPSPPDQATPPLLEVSTGVFGRFGTAFSAHLWLGGSPYPVCAETGLTIGMSASAWAGLDVTPTKLPWWSVGAGGELEGTVAFEGLGYSLVEVPIDLVSFDHGAVRTAGVEIPPDDTTARYLSGEDQRWVVAIDQIDVANPGLEWVDAAPTTDGGVVVIASERIGHFRLLRLDAFGRLEWNRTYRTVGGRIPRAVEVVEDGRIVVAGEPAFAVVHEPGGEPLWANVYDLSDGVNLNWGMTAQDMTVLPLPDGDFDIVLVGLFSRGVGREDEGAVLRLDSSGGVQGAHILDGDGKQQLLGVSPGAEGTLLLAGRTEDGPDPFSLHNGWLLEVDPTDLTVLRDVALVSSGRTGILHDVVQGADGSVFAVGQAIRDVTHTGSAFVARWTPEGDVRHALLVHDVASEATQDFEVTPAVQVSDGAVDALLGIAAVDDGIVVAGHAGTDIRTGWVAKLGPQLGAEWFVVLDGPGWDGFSSVNAVDDGLIAAGYSASLGEAGKAGDTQALVAKLPFEGLVSLHEDESDVVLRYLVPGVRETSGGVGFAPDGMVTIDPDIEVLGAVVDSITDVSDKVFEEVTEPECVTLLTATGRPTTTDPCPDPDRLAPVVRIVSGGDGPYTLDDTMLVDVVFYDESGLAHTEVRLDDAVVAVGETVSMSDLGAGAHTIEAEAEDSSGLSTTASRAFEVVEGSGPVDDTGGVRASPAGGGCGGCGHGGASTWAGLLLMMLAGRRRSAAGR